VYATRRTTRSRPFDDVYATRCTTRSRPFDDVYATRRTTRSRPFDDVYATRLQDRASLHRKGMLSLHHRAQTPTPQPLVHHRIGSFVAQVHAIGFIPVWHVQMVVTQRYWKTAHKTNRCSVFQPLCVGCLQSVGNDVYDSCDG